MGLFVALRLACSGEKVVCLKAENVIEAEPRAMIYHPAVASDFKRAGLGEDIQRCSKRARKSLGERLQTKPQSPHLSLIARPSRIPA